MLNRNLPNWERLLRLGLGICLVAYAVLNWPGWLPVALGCAGLVAGLTAALAWCPACALFGRGGRG